MISEHELLVGGVRASALAAAYGTPLLVVDTGVLDANVARLTAVAAGAGAEVAYAGKALLFVALARRLAASSLLLDVCSLGELLTAERAAFPAARLVMHGCGKRDAELEAAVAGRVARIVVDGFEELQRLAARANSKRPLDVLLRVNSGVAVDTHAYIRTGGENSKFGFARGDVQRAIDVARATSGLRFAGIHTHLGSQIFDAGALLAGLEATLDVAQAAVARGIAVPCVVAGGGFGVGSRPAERDMDAAAAFSALCTALSDGSRARGMATPRLGIEPGRAIVANAGTSLYRVLAVKQQGTRRFVIIDGSIADNPRPALYGAYHHPVAVNAHDGASVETAVCGRSCESDELVVAELPAALQAGDLIALSTTGGYTYSMASNYNRFPKPAVAFASGGAHRLVVRRELDDAILANDVIDA